MYQCICLGMIMYILCLLHTDTRHLTHRSWSMWGVLWIDTLVWKIQVPLIHDSQCVQCVHASQMKPRTEACHSDPASAQAFQKGKTLPEKSQGRKTWQKLNPRCDKQHLSSPRFEPQRPSWWMSFTKCMYYFDVLQGTSYSSYAEQFYPYEFFM